MTTAENLPAVLQTVPLGAQWPTIDPFLFCAHHHDVYPPGTSDFAPNAPLTGRQIGQDFADIDGWNMYHGSTMPGFPQHPHRGFETVSYLRAGIIDHADSMGASARFGAGDTQWMTAGRGVVHSEMFPLLDAEAPNPLHLFQIWLNLPAENKMVDPHFAMLWSEDVPQITHSDDHGNHTNVTLIAGQLANHNALAPAPHSWAANPENHVNIWHVEMDAGATWEMPPTSHIQATRVVYFYQGSTLQIADQSIDENHGAVVDQSRPLTLVAGDQPARVMVLAGRPIGEPVAQHGPFVMNTAEEIDEAFADYQRTKFGGWPWPSPDPHHDGESGRFANHGDGNIEKRSL